MGGRRKAHLAQTDKWWRQSCTKLCCVIMHLFTSNVHLFQPVNVNIFQQHHKKDQYDWTCNVLNFNITTQILFQSATTCHQSGWRETEAKVPILEMLTWTIRIISSSAMKVWTSTKPARVEKNGYKYENTFCTSIKISARINECFVVELNFTLLFLLFQRICSMLN